MPGLRKFEDFKEYKGLIEEFMEERVFNIYYNELYNSFYVAEMCDQYFSRGLSSEDCNKLSEMFAKLSAKIKEFEASPPMEHYLAVEKDEKEKAEEARVLEEKRRKISEEMKKEEEERKANEKVHIDESLEFELDGKECIANLDSLTVLNRSVAEIAFHSLNSDELNDKYDIVGCKTIAYDKITKEVLEDIEVTFNNVTIKGDKMSFDPCDMHVLHIKRK